MKRFSHIALLATVLLTLCCSCRSARAKAVAQPAQQEQQELRCVAVPDSMANVVAQYERLTVNFNPRLRIPNAVAYRLTAADVAQCDAPDAPRRKDFKFNADPQVTGCPEWYEYKRSGYDRGHMAPAMDMKISTSIMEQCFLMTNIAPQVQSLNGGQWHSMEQAIHKLAKARKELYIVTGTITAGDSGVIERIGPNADIAVPRQLFKLLYVPSLGKGVAFLFPNAPASTSWRSHATSIRHIEQLTGLDFFPTLPQQQQDAIETSGDLSWWN